MILQAEHLNKNYRRDGRDFPVVADVSLTLEPGDFVSIIGRSGSGKTTLLNLFTGLLTPDGGRVLWDGQDLSALSDDARAALRNERVGYVPQGSSAISSLTALENVCLPYDLHPREGSAFEQAAALLERVGLAHVAGSYPSSLSGGELRRVAIARALINAPELVVADEPTGDLDRENRDAVMQLFRSISEEGITVLLVTHDTETLPYSKTVLRMEDGRLQAEKGGGEA